VLGESEPATGYEHVLCFFFRADLGDDPTVSVTDDQSTTSRRSA
jgi:hypothetical protein